MRHPLLRGLPNGLSVFRLLCSPLVAALLLIDAQGLRYPITVLFALASLTDYLDGYLARRLRVVSPLGVFMDLAADKVLVTTVLIILVGTGGAPSWMTAIIVAREFVVSGLRTYASAKGVQIAASQLGKWKTAITLVAIILALLHLDRAIVLTGLSLATAITLASMVEYLARNWHVIAGSQG